METIKVNMNPNPLDVQTIHASQNDGEARQWEFELHNNGELIDTSEVTEQLFFKSYKGGTEQLLPENGSTPTTSPFKGDIKYPQGLLTDQEFTYRQSPTEEDGLAKITDIKGNTLVWNQLANVGTLSAIASYSGYLNIGTFSFVANHKYLIKYHQDNTMASNTRNTLQVRFATVGQTVTENATANAHLSQGDYSWLFNSTYTDTNTIVRFWVADNDVSVSYSNIMVIDLTQMGLDITDPSEFTSLFSKPYYDYCQGAMLSFGGRNVKFNQLVQNGNFADSSNWVAEGSATINSVTNNTINVTTANAGSGIAQISFPMTNGHQYLLVATIKTTGQTNISVSGLGSVLFNTNSFVTKGGVFTWTAATGNQWSVRIRNFDANSATFEARNVMLIDLTEMFGVGNEPSAEGFFEIFKSDYYAYTTGKYMNIGQPVSLKTVSKNQFDTQVITTSYTELVLTKTQGTIRAVYSGGSQYAGFNFYGSPVFTDTFLKGKYRLSFDVKNLDTQWTVGLRQGASFLGGGQALAISNDGHYSFTIDAEANPNCYLSFARTGNKTTAYDVTFSNIQLELGTTETSYEPYTSSTLSLPISTYFPTGMKSAGNVYDELTENKAITRIGSVDLGSLRWTYSADSQVFTSGAVLQRALTKNGICARYEKIDGWTEFNQSSKSIFLPTNSNFVRIKDSGYTDATAFKSAMDGIILYYELATPTETSFTTASLVTENAEIPLSNEDGVLVGKCTEELSAEPGFHDAKIKLSDADGECYSNKIQLHVERKP